MSPHFPGDIPGQNRTAALIVAHPGHELRAGIAGSVLGGTAAAAVVEMAILRRALAGIPRAAGLR